MLLPLSNGDSEIDNKVYVPLCLPTAAKASMFL